MVRLRRAIRRTAATEVLVLVPSKLLAHKSNTRSFVLDDAMPTS
jgi:hypothetical protein